MVVRPIVVCFGVALAAGAQAAVITVDDDGPADYATIQEAVDAASRGDVIKVLAGDYAGAYINKSDIEIVGAEDGVNIVADFPDETRYPDWSWNFILIDNAHGVRVSNLTFRSDAQDAYGRGFAIVDSSDLDISHNRFLTGMFVAVEALGIRDSKITYNEVDVDAGYNSGYPMAFMFMLGEPIDNLVAHNKIAVAGGVYAGVGIQISDIPHPARNTIVDNEVNIHGIVGGIYGDFWWLDGISLSGEGPNTVVCNDLGGVDEGYALGFYEVTLEQLLADNTLRCNVGVDDPYPASCVQYCSR